MLRRRLRNSQYATMDGEDFLAFCRICEQYLYQFEDLQVNVMLLAILQPKEEKQY